MPAAGAQDQDFDGDVSEAIPCSELTKLIDVALKGDAFSFKLEHGHARLVVPKPRGRAGHNGFQLAPGEQRFKADLELVRRKPSDDPPRGSRPPAADTCPPQLVQ
jgi:hypothetical protein